MYSGPLFVGCLQPGSWDDAQRRLTHRISIRLLFFSARVLAGVTGQLVKSPFSNLEAKSQFIEFHNATEDFFRLLALKKTKDGKSIQKFFRQTRFPIDKFFYL